MSTLGQLGWVTRPGVHVLCMFCDYLALRRCSHPHTPRSQRWQDFFLHHSFKKGKEEAADLEIQTSPRPSASEKCLAIYFHDLDTCRPSDELKLWDALFYREDNCHAGRPAGSQLPLPT